MVAKRIIACLDVKAGRVVKGVQFENLRDHGDPAELAKRYGDLGADEVTFLDIGATLEQRDTLRDVVRETAQGLFVPLTVGGGVRTVDDAKALLRAGADKVAVNTAALRDPSLLSGIARDYGEQCVVAAIDAKSNGDDWVVHSHGGTTPTARRAVEWATEAVSRGAGEIMLTSIDRDGTRNGYDLELTRAVVEHVRVPVVASGGCGTPEHAVAAFTRGGADAALVAGIFHDGSFTPQSFKERVHGHNVEVRV